MAAIPHPTTSTLRLAEVRTDGGTQSRVMINMATVADYADLMASGADFPPVIVFHDGVHFWLADGFHRFYAAQQLGLVEIAAAVHAGDVRAARLFSIGANADHGLQRSREDKRNAVLMLLNDPEWARWSDREIARRCVVGPDMVGDLRKSLSLSDSERIYVDRHGNMITMHTANIGRAQEDDRPGLFDNSPRGDQSGENDWQPIEALYLENRPRAYPLTAANHISASDGYDGDEWYTPAEYVEAARRVMGGIDLDPASCEIAQRTVQAAHYFTKDEDGLQFNWPGRVFLNPPYSYPLIERFTEHLIAQVSDGFTTEAILLVNNSSDTDWFQALLSRYPACFTDGRVRFYRDTGEYFGTRQGQTFFYCGPNPDRFVAEFARYGVVVEAVS